MTSSNIGVCYVPKGSTYAEDLCGFVLLHYLFYYVLFKNAFHKMQYWKVVIKNKSEGFEIKENISKSEI